MARWSGGWGTAGSVLEVRSIRGTVGSWCLRGLDAMRTSRVDLEPQRSKNKPAPRRLAKRWRERWTIVAVSFCLIGAMVVATMGLSRLVGSMNSKAPTATGSTFDETHVGKIVLQAGTGKCKQIKFDNDNGGFAESSASCDEKIIFDKHGVPVPQGTVHRLDAISKSFAPHQ